jgi:glycosyltransferase involved in cell wall biosynthesis
MNIGFEAKRFFTNNTGLGNYSRFVVRALSNYFPDSDYYLYTPRVKFQTDAVPILERRNVHVIKPGEKYTLFHATSLWRSFGISRDASIGRLQVFHGLSHELPVNLPEKIKKITTIHDLIFYRYPEFYKPIDIAIYKRKLKYACRTADKIIAISHQTKLDLLEFLNIDPKKIEIIYQGAHPNFKSKLSREQIDSVTRKYNLPKEYILNVGTIEKRKNVLVLVKALAQMPKESRIPLVILGRSTAYLKQVMEVAQQLNVSGHLLFPADVPFVDFPAIYQGARLFVYPSLFEGFGIPLIEAIESKVPVITSVGSCFREAAGAASVYVDPHDSEGLAYQIERVLSDSALRNVMVSESCDYIRQFEPEVIAKNIYNVYRA